MFTFPAFGYAPFSGWCQQGGQTVTVQGLPSTTLVQQSFPNLAQSGAGPSVTVYLTGTQTKAVIYSDNMGTPLSNPFPCMQTGQYQFFATGPGVTYDLLFAGNGVPSFTRGLEPGVDPIAVPNSISDSYFKGQGMGFADACAYAQSAGLTLTVSELWPALPTQSFSCSIACLNGGIIQPAANKKIIFTSPVSVPSGQQCFDTSIAGPGSVVFVVPTNPVSASSFGATVGSQGGSSDTLTAALGGAQGSLPVLPGNATVRGEVDLQNTGPGGNCYLMNKTFQLSSATILQGARPTASEICPTTTFTSTGPGDYMFNVINQNGSGMPNNNNFHTNIADISLNTNIGGNYYLGGISWGTSIGSKLSNLVIITSGTAIAAGGITPQGAIDTTSADNLQIGLEPQSGFPCPQAIVFHTAGTQTNTFNLTTMKVTASPQTGCSQVPAVDTGSNTTINMANLNFEGPEYPIAVRSFEAGAQFTNIQAFPDCYQNCTLSQVPWVCTISAFATNSRCQGMLVGFATAVVFGDTRIPSQMYPGQFEIIDNNLNVERVSSNCTTGTAQQITWPTMLGATTTDGACTWTVNRVLVSCAAPFVISNQPCVGAYGATSGTDPTVYSFDCSSTGCTNGNLAAGNSSIVFGNLQAKGNLTVNGNLTVLGCGNCYTDSGVTGPNSLSISAPGLIIEPGAEMLVKIDPGNSLHAGANSITITGGSTTPTTLPIVSHRTGADISSPYSGGLTIDLRIGNAAALDMSQ
jgi:hypothetical protein